MDYSQFTNIFLPGLVSDYVNRVLPRHALIDFDSWKRFYPDIFPTSTSQVLWNEIRFTCDSLTDGTLLITFALPRPQKKGDAKFAAIRINLQEKEELHATYYMLCKPQDKDDAWDILHLPLPLGQDKMELKFLCKIEGQNSLRNFVRTVQQNPFDDNSYNKSFWDDIKVVLGGMFKAQA